MRGSIEVHRYLTERGIPHEFYRLSHPLRQIDEAAALLGLLRTQVLMAELFERAETPALALLPAGSVASVQAIAAATGGATVRPAEPARVTEHTGFLAHWLPPVGHERPSLVVADEELGSPGVVYAAGGDPGVMLMMRAEDLFRATAATVRRLSAQPEERVARPAAGPNLLAG